MLDPYFSATKVKWILDNVEGARARAERGELAFGTVDSWLIWHLTSGHKHVTDVTNASRTLLFNIVKGEWDPEMLKLFGVPESMLPEVGWSSERVGEVTTTLGLGGVAIAGIAGDQQAALFGQLCWNAGEAKNTYGTGCFLLQNIGTEFVRSRHKLITTVAASAQKRLEYALEGSIFIGGAVVQWLRDNLKLIGASAEVEALAASVPDTGGVVFVPAFVGLGAPHWDAHAAGMLIGLRRDTGPGQIARAALEAIAFQVADVLEAVHSETGAPLKELRVDGGAAVNDLLMQFQADVLGVPVVRPRVTETTALGAAYLAGLATGFWASADALRAERKGDVRFEPKMARGSGPSGAGAGKRPWSGQRGGPPNRCVGRPCGLFAELQRLADLLVPAFQRLFEFEHEFAGVGAVDEAVIEAEAEVLHGANGDGVVAFGVGEHGGLFAQAADGEDGRLGLVDDGHAELAAKGAGVGEREGGSADFVGRELFGAGAEGEIGDGAGEIGEAALLGLADDGHDEAPVERDGDAEMDVLVVADGEAVAVFSSEALTMGKRRSAATAAAAMKGM